MGTLLVLSVVDYIDYRSTLACLEYQAWYTCMASNVEYPGNTGTAESAGRIKELLLDTNRDPWVQIEDPPVWVKLIKVGVVFKHTRSGTVFERRRLGSSEDGELELFIFAERHLVSFQRRSHATPYITIPRELQEKRPMYEASPFLTGLSLPFLR